MFKALLVASLAMLACCAAATWAGPVSVTSFDRSDVSAEAEPAGLAAPKLALTSGATGDEFSLLDSVVVEGFVPVSRSATYEGGSSLQTRPVEDGAPLTPHARPAVIPLPRPLYAALVLIVLVIGARRLIARTCHA